MSGPIDAPRRPLPVDQLERSTHVRDDAEKHREAPTEEQHRETPAREEEAPEKPHEPGKGEKVDYRA